MELPYLITGLVHYVCGHELRISSGKQRRSGVAGAAGHRLHRGVRCACRPRRPGLRSKIRLAQLHQLREPPLDCKSTPQRPSSAAQQCQHLPRRFPAGQIDVSQTKTAEELHRHAHSELRAFPPRSCQKESTLGATRIMTRRDPRNC